MIMQKLRVLCLTNSQQLPALINSIYGAIEHEIVVVGSYAEMVERQAQKTFDLFIIDHADHQALVHAVAKIKLTNPNLCMIILEESYDNLDDFVDFSNVHLVARSEMVSKLPLVLGEVYSTIKKRAVTSINYFSLLKAAFFSVQGFVAVVNEKGQFIFLNREAEKTLNLTGQDYTTLLFPDFIAEGPAVWKYLNDSCLIEKRVLEKYRIVFLTFLPEALEKALTIQPLEVEKTYLLIQETPSSIGTDDPCLYAEFELLDKFADSIANELLNPVNVFSGRLQLLAAAIAPSEKAQKNLTALKKQVERISELMEKLLTFSRLKQDAIPQKINLNEVFKRIVLAPSIQQWLQNEHFFLEFDFAEDIRILQGLLAHFDLLFKMLLEMSFECLGSEGRIVIRTLAGKKVVTVVFQLSYNRSIFADSNTLLGYLGRRENGKIKKSIEGTIIKHLIYRYHGKYHIVQSSSESETLELVIPVDNDG